MSEVLLQATGVTAGYGLVPAIQGIDLTLRAGEVVTLLGPNGAGKTTTLLALTGLLPISSGSVQALGIPVKAGRATKLSRAGTILVPDDRGVFPDLTVSEHFRLVDSRRRRERMARVLDAFPALAKLTGRRAGLLSGGEQQMLAIAKSLLAGPRILMVDEMSLGLAPIIVQEMLPGIAALAREEGFAVLLVEQHVAIALSVSDRALVLSQGRPVLEDSAAALLADPSRVETAYFGAVSA
ncbi:ATP-binding cassette domain-containing protein [Nocardioides carbamazepini]|uniref:ABC transporter ATP-binding protein n=1 Tax=Nocardioides carbamazepini TaxID=2854259 RepID=UPI00214A8531|nr:ATP-binding cassette domain-containing protein [Nocardioides carbamazepini]MCR1784924.1 ATP-binding cassette domain-containing protein [Nocardioides carbamazepini]